MQKLCNENLITGLGNALMPIKKSVNSDISTTRDGEFCLFFVAAFYSFVFPQPQTECSKKHKYLVIYILISPDCD